MECISWQEHLSHVDVVGDSLTASCGGCPRVFAEGHQAMLGFWEPWCAANGHAFPNQRAHRFNQFSGCDACLNNVANTVASDGTETSPVLAVQPCEPPRDPLRRSVQTTATTKHRGRRATSNHEPVFQRSPSKITFGLRPKKVGSVQIAVRRVQCSQDSIRKLAPAEASEHGRATSTVGGLRGNPM